MQFKTVNINDLTGADYNPRKDLQPEDIEYQKIKRSIEEFGYVEPVIINDDHTIIGGHQRVKVLKDLGYEELQVIQISVDKTKEKALNVALNKITGEWDIDKLSQVLEDLDLEEFDLEITGFDLDEIDDLLGIEPEVVEDNYVVILPEEPKSKLGDIYQLGRHRVMCGDSTKIEDVQKLMDGVRVDLLLTDPPYNVDYTGGTKDALKIQNDKQSDSEFRQFLVDAFTCADSVMKPGAVFYIWHADSEGYNFRGACHDIDWEVRQCLIWNKNAMVMGRQDYHWKHEPCLYGWKSGGSHLWASDRKQTTILEFDRPTQNKEHPTMKPVKLFDYQMQNNTKKEDVVLDLFGGSGTTLIASEQNGRISYTMEFDPKYVDVIINRWEQQTNQKAILLNGDR